MIKKFLKKYRYVKLNFKKYLFKILKHIHTQTLIRHSDCI